MKRNYMISLSVYSLLHFAVDLTCAALMFSRVYPHYEIWGLAMLLYNYFAFAMQLPFGIIADRLSKNSLVAGLGCVFVALGCFLSFAPLAGAVIAGIGNGLFHVGGGLDSLNGRNGKCAPAGIFVSPGAVGLWIGTLFGMKGWFPLPLAVFLLAVGAALPFVFRKNFGGGENAPFSLSTPSKMPVAAITAVFLLFLVVVVRSLAGMVFTFEWKSALALPYVLAVALGKAAGGFAADLAGAKKTAMISLPAAAVLFLLGNNPVCGLPAVFLFNMTMPLTLTAAAEVFPGAKGASFGLMTFGLFIGFLPVFFGLTASSLWVYAGLSILGCVLILPGLVLGEKAAKK